MKKLFITLMFLSLPLLAQNALDNQVYYYGDDADYRLDTDSLIIDDGEADSGEWIIPNQPIEIAVDSNWTASGIGFKTYNNLEGTWDLVCDEDGTVIEYTVAIGAPVRLKANDVANLKKVKFTKITSASEVNQSGADGKLQVTTIRFN